MAGGRGQRGQRGSPGRPRPRPPRRPPPRRPTVGLPPFKRTVSSPTTPCAATFNYRSASTITTLNGRYGTITFAETTLRCTVTNCSLWAANMDLRNGIGTPTFSNAVQQLGSGQPYGDVNSSSTPTPSL